MPTLWGIWNPKGIPEELVKHDGALAIAGACCCQNCCCQNADNIIRGELAVSIIDGLPDSTTSWDSSEFGGFHNVEYNCQCSSLSGTYMCPVPDDIGTASGLVEPPCYGGVSGELEATCFARDVPGTTGKIDYGAGWLLWGDPLDLCVLTASFSFQGQLAGLQEGSIGITKSMASPFHCEDWSGTTGPEPTGNCTGMGHEAGPGGESNTDCDACAGTLTFTLVRG